MKKALFVSLAVAGLLGACTHQNKTSAPPVAEPTPAVAVAPISTTPTYGSVSLPPAPTETRVAETLPPPPPAPKSTVTHAPKSTGTSTHTAVATSAHPKTYTVKKGDTLSAIAKKFYGKASAYTKILAANPGMKADKIVAGTTIKLP